MSFAPPVANVKKCSVRRRKSSDHRGRNAIDEHQTAQTALRKTQEYAVSACVPGDLSNAELATCVEIVRDGGP